MFRRPETLKITPRTHQPKVVQTAPMDVIVTGKNDKPFLITDEMIAERAERTCALGDAACGFAGINSLRAGNQALIHKLCTKQGSDCETKPLAPALNRLYASAEAEASRIPADS